MEDVVSDIRLKRIYEPAAANDGTRVLVDRLWPRGLPKSKAEIDLWLKEIAPSGALRQWFGHDPRRWSEFRKRYKAELASASEELKRLRHLARQGRLTLLYGARDGEHNQAVVLKEVLSH
ncbi:MAG: DUF488 domain-containing protein [Alphaproteobacteria bacterium]|nr:DUF488 domain-containing protein [Alphaproteobacteria bacterium]MDE2013008.1 DUF488 domain-containing protein [Alphaproteobacteria bacterium]MDE2072401.1 DUF488 domain-containing protein [Alphaproteobacteria bacterium]